MLDPVRRLGLPALSGLLIGTSYIPFPPWASLFCFVPLWLYWSRQTRLLDVVLGGFVTAFVFTLIGFNWVTYLMHEFVHLDWPLAVLAMIAFALLAHLFVPLAGLLWFGGRRLMHGSEPFSLGLMALITTLCEFYSPTLFDWNFGYSWYGASIPIYHWAEVVGFSGLSAATLLANLPLLYAWLKRRERAGRWILGVMVSLFLLLNIGGLWLESRLPSPDASVRALLVQGNIGNAEKMAAEQGNRYQEAILQAFMKETDRGLATAHGAIDFVVWPETAFPALLSNDLRPSAYQQHLAEFLKERNIALVTGAYGLDKETRRLTNSLFVLNRNGDVLAPHYSKTILLAFGEFLPGEVWFPVLREWLPIAGQFARGQGPTTLLELDRFRMGPQICYESLFPSFSRGLANLGAQFIVNVTNDSWYGDWQEPYQHEVMTLARGVEFRRPVLRVTNTGITTAALASGQILEQSPIYQPWAAVFEVPYLRNPAPTFYQRWFWLVPGLLWSSLLMLLLAGFWLRKHRQVPA